MLLSACISQVPWFSVLAISISIVTMWIIATLLLAIPSTVFTGTAGLTEVSNDFARPGRPLAWPELPPGWTIWPTPYQVTKERKFGVTHFGATAPTSDQTTHGMELWRYGWPVPILERSLYYFPFDDARYGDLPIVPIPSLSVRWGTLGVSTLAVTSVLALIIASSASLKTMRRLAQGRCIRCAYLLGESDRCTECGRLRMRLSRS